MPCKREKSQKTNVTKWAELNALSSNEVAEELDVGIVTVLACGV